MCRFRAPLNVILRKFTKMCVPREVPRFTLYKSIAFFRVQGH